MFSNNYSPICNCTLNIHFGVISKPCSSTCGHSADVSLSIGGVQNNRQVLNAGFLIVKILLTFTISTSIDHMAPVSPSYEPVHVVAFSTDFVLRSRGDRTLE